MRQPVLAGLVAAAAAIACVAACNKSAPAPAAAPAAAATTDLPRGSTATQVGPGAEPSGYVATNKPDPKCVGCTGPDAGSAPQYFGKPDLKLDAQTLAEVQASIDANNTLIEGGIDILEKNAKTPDKALAELEKYLKDHASAIDLAHIKAAEIRARLRGAGYDQDIPAEIRPAFEQRMGKIAERLERMREVYASRREVLGAFGKLFPRGK
ncbi:MAG: hypothetical protein HY902_17065 [Deltaproteobacteria bacterium]|nr:hypothetical protein [Deltaproteobacteria bacterium]